MGVRNVAILGASSHIAKGLTSNFLRKSRASLQLFTRDSGRTTTFLESLGSKFGKRCKVHEGYSGFDDKKFQVIINCIGPGSPSKMNNRYSEWFTLTEYYDNLVLCNVRKNPETTYINFSSGAVYGTDFSRPVDDNSATCLKVNQLAVSDYYSIARLNAEAKHRSFADLRIIDLRIFSYFSRFVDLDSGYLMTDLIRALLEGKAFKTGRNDITRDYVHPDDLFRLVCKCIGGAIVNGAVDVASRKPVRKSDIIRFFRKRYGLTCDVQKTYRETSPNGSKNVYFSRSGAAKILGYRPEYSSMETIAMEAAFILSGMKPLPDNKRCGG